MNVKIWIW